MWSARASRRRDSVETQSCLDAAIVGPRLPHIVSMRFPFEMQIFWPCERLGWFGFVLVSTTAPRQEFRTSIPYDRIVSQSAITNE